MFEMFVVNNFWNYSMATRHCLVWMFLAFLVESTVAVTGGGCQSDWFSIRYSCYYVSNRKESWNNAQTFCRLRGGYLAEPETPGEHHHLTQYLRGVRFSSFPVSEVWFGLRKRFDVYTFAHSSKQPQYSFWESGKPTGRSCVMGTRNANFQWSDENCERRMNFVCQTKAFTATQRMPARYTVSTIMLQTTTQQSDIVTTFSTFAVDQFSTRSSVNTTGTEHLDATARMDDKSGARHAHGMLNEVPLLMWFLSLINMFRLC